MLSDADILYRMSVECSPASRIGITPWLDEDAYQPASLDLKLGDVDMDACMCPGEDAPHWSILPGEFILATTLERIELPADLAARVEGKSSWGRKGLAVHITAGFIDPGFKGQITLELKNLGRDPLWLHAGSYICQLSFHQLSSPAKRPYGSPGLGSRYQNQKGVTASR